MPPNAPGVPATLSRIAAPVGVASVVYSASRRWCRFQRVQPTPAEIVILVPMSDGPKGIEAEESRTAATSSSRSVQVRNPIHSIPVPRPDPAVPHGAAPLASLFTSTAVMT